MLLCFLDSSPGNVRRLFLGLGWWGPVLKTRIAQQSCSYIWFPENRFDFNFILMYQFIVCFLLCFCTCILWRVGCIYKAVFKFFFSAFCEIFIHPTEFFVPKHFYSSVNISVLPVYIYHLLFPVHFFLFSLSRWLAHDCGNLTTSVGVVLGIEMTVRSSRVRLVKPCC